MNGRTLFGLLAVSMMLMAPLLPVYAVLPADVSSWYNTMTGVLSSDYYYMYPYAAYDLKVGFSKFGEKINPFDGTGVGLQYRGIPTDTVATSGADPFCNPIVLKEEWVEGWWIMIYYHHSSGWRMVWAYALFGDTMAWGSPAAGDVLGSTTNPPARVTSDGWIRFPSKAPSGALYSTAQLLNPQNSILLTPHGGRKTNGKCVTGDYKLLYDGPREAIYSVSTDIYDNTIIAGTDGSIIGEDAPIINPIVTVTILIEFNKVKKEVIQKKDVKFHPDKMILAFGSIPETIAAVDNPYGVELRLFPQGGSFYNTRNTDQKTTGNAIIKFSNRGEWDLGLAKAGYYKSYSHWYTGLSTLYDSSKYHWINRGSEYDKAQIISAYAPFVGWTAFWPRLDWFTCDGFNLALSHGDITSHQDDDQKDTSTEPAVPFIAGQWNFVLADDPTYTQFRGVTTYGVTDQNDCDDIDAQGKGTPYPVVAGAHVNVKDTEVMFQNNEVFNPFDLFSAVHMQTSRIVDFFSGTDALTAFTLSKTPITVTVDEWDDYCTFAERVEVGGAPAVRKTTPAVTSYLEYKLEGAVITFGKAPPTGTKNIKVLYSTAPTQEKLDKFTYDADAQTNYPLSFLSKTMTIQAVVNPATGKAVDSQYYRKLDTPSADTYYDSLQVDAGAKYWDATAVTDNTVLKVVYEVVLGTYEWITVGREAAAIDSAGAVMVSEAFDSLKNIAVVKAGLDVSELAWGPNAPYIFYRFTMGSGTRADYRDTTRGRTKLNDDFCTKNAIDTSSLIHIGGPLANLGTEYLNDFLPVKWGMQDAYHTTHADFRGKMVAMECWDRYGTTGPHGRFTGTSTTGYAVIAVYKDIHGTVHFTVWGINGQDTYYACMWLWSKAMYTWEDKNNNGIVDTNEWWTDKAGIVYLESENRGVVAIVLKFNYSKHYSDEWSTTKAGFVTLLERIGTISEKHPHQDP